MTKRIHNDRTQRAMERGREARAARDAQAWLASLSPEHRAIHVDGRPCGQCFNAALEAGARNLSATLRRVGVVAAGNER